MTEYDFDLLVRAGRVVCIASELDGPGAVAIRGDRIVAAGPDVRGSARRTCEFPRGLLLPGLVDLHAHPAKNGSKYGVDPDREFLPRGVTTVLSQGDAGADNWRAYRRETMEGSRIRIRLAINLSRKGEPPGGPCFRDSSWVDTEACAKAVELGGDLIWGVAANVSRDVCTLDPRDVLRAALQVAVRTGKPLLYGMRDPSDWPLAEQLALLRPGDVVTYVFRSGEWSIVGTDGQIRPEVLAARERGVLFDACHGLRSFAFRTAEAAFAAGFYPDTVSTDQYEKHLGSTPQHDLPLTMSKFLAAGMPEREIFARVGPRPAEILQLAEEVGSLQPGSCADLTILEMNDPGEPLRDFTGDTRNAGYWEAKLVVRGGVFVE